MKWNVSSAFSGGLNSNPKLNFFDEESPHPSHLAAMFAIHLRIENLPWDN